MPVLILDSHTIRDSHQAARPSTLPWFIQAPGLVMGIQNPWADPYRSVRAYRSRELNTNTAVCFQCFVFTDSSADCVWIAAVQSPRKFKTRSSSVRHKDTRHIHVFFSASLVRHIFVYRIGRGWVRGYYYLAILSYDPIFLLFRVLLIAYFS